MASLLLNWEAHRLRADVKALENTIRGRASGAARQQTSERMGEAVAYVAAAVQGGKPPGDALKEAAGRYPDVALALGQKLIKGKIGGELGGLLQG